VERTIQREDAQVGPVLGRDEVLEVRSVCRDILVAPHVQEFAIQVVMATQPEHSEAHNSRANTSGMEVHRARSSAGRMRAGARADARRYHLSIEDIDAVAASVLRHRIILNFDAHADGQTPDTILSTIIREAAAHASAA